MKYVFNAGGVFALYLSTTPFAHAVFSAPVPEPATAALVVAGGLVAGGLRYLVKRKRDRRRDE
jgi:xanthine/uracil permease